MLAVSVRDGEDLLLVLRVNRNAKGEVYAVPARNDPGWSKKANWDPHASVKKDGSWHIKSYDRKVLKGRKQKPDKDFRGSQDVWSEAMPDARAVNIKCDPTEFDEVFEIPIQEVRTAKHPNLVVTIVSPNTEPVPPNESQLIRRKVLRDGEPWIVISLYDYVWLDMLFPVSPS
jgi:hypothetical protein